MNIADRIQNLRKTRGLSQEDLAEKLGVSRQAVSKWESGQNIPDVDKIIVMSDFFEVSTDYLLKGKDSASGKTVLKREKPDAFLFTVAGTAFNVLGLVAAGAIWYEAQRMSAFAIGFILMIIGCAVYFTGITVSDPGTKSRAKRIFWMINVWILMILPYLLLYYRIFLDGVMKTGISVLTIFRIAPVRFAFFLLSYLIIGLILSKIICIKLPKDEK